MNHHLGLVQNSLKVNKFVGIFSKSFYTDKRTLISLLKNILNTFALKSYFKFLLKSTNEHGIHSPFVYDLVSKCFYNKTKYTEYKLLEKYRKDLLNSSDSISVEDFGAGSTVFKSNKRKVSDLAKVAGASKSESELLFRIAKYFNPEQSLELGTSLAISTYTISTALPQQNITTVEGSKSIFEWNKQNTSKYNFKNTEFVNSLFDDYLETLPPNTQFDLIYIDGNHTYDATIKYFEILKKHTHKNSVIIFDDIHWSEGMDKAWNEIIADKEVTLSIDTFHFGMVFFRKEQYNKEHFVIRS